MEQRERERLVALELVSGAEVAHRSDAVGREVQALLGAAVLHPASQRRAAPAATSASRRDILYMALPPVERL